MNILELWNKYPIIIVNVASLIIASIIVVPYNGPFFLSRIRGANEVGDTHMMIIIMIFTIVRATITGVVSLLHLRTKHVRMRHHMT